MAKGIYRAFLNYKREHELRLTGVSKTIVPTEQEEDNAPAIAQKDTESVNTAPQQEKLLAEAKTKPAATAKTAPKRPIVVESATTTVKLRLRYRYLLLPNLSPKTTNG